MRRLLCFSLVFSFAVATSAAAQERSSKLDEAAPVGLTLAKLTSVDFGTPAAFAQAQTEWQRQYDKAQSDRQKGKKKMIIGYAAMGGGLVIALAGASSCDYYSCGSGGVVLGNIVMLGGAGYGSWGFYEWSRAGNKMDLLEVQKASGKLATLIPISENHSIVASKSAIGYRMTW